MLYDYNFEGRKPSKNQVIKQINEGIKQNADTIQISWGENRIDIFNVYPNILYGSGWIKGISGHDIAEELNKKNTRDLLNLYNN